MLDWKEAHVEDRIIGHISLDIFRRIVPNIMTDTVVLTEMSEAHIRAKHPDDLQAVIDNLPIIVSSPDYILEDRHKDTFTFAILLKEIHAEGTRYRVILKLAVAGGERDRNFVTTAFRISPKKWEKYLRNSRATSFTRYEP